ncbi:MAG TPA: hypothetical protein VET87_17730 [Rubrivivax sp.]|nr:hypothetical protein [Rubrivivax sp.]
MRQGEHDLFHQFDALHVEIRRQTFEAGDIAAGRARLASRPVSTPACVLATMVLLVAFFAANAAGPACHQHIDLQPYQFGGQFGQSLRLVVCVPVLENHVFAIDPSERLQIWCEPVRSSRLAIAEREKADPRQLCRSLFDWRWRA